MVSTAGGEAIPMTAEGSSAWSPGWSPDGKCLTFMASSRGQGSQVFMLGYTAGSASRSPITSRASRPC